MLKRLYNWVLRWAESPYALWALLILAFCESSFFPIPPDVLLIALALSKPKKSFTYVLIASIGSILGGIFGYFLGFEFMDLLGKPILNFYGMIDKYEYVRELYIEYDAWAVGIAGFTPIPYKIFTIAAGACKIDFSVFVVASFISRSARFFIVGSLLFFFGPPIKVFIDKYFNLLTIIFVILLISGFVLLKWVF